MTPAGLGTARGLREIVAAEAESDTFPAAKDFGTYLQQHYGATVAGIVFYGSCLRANTDEGLLLDFYVLVDSYARALRHVTSAVFARLLPPNVYYHEIAFEQRTVRAKVAVISVGQFLHGLGPETFTSTIWARFAQPALILYARNAEIRRRLIDGLAAAVHTTMTRTSPLLRGDFTASDLWITAFGATYAAELRPEGAAKSLELVDRDLARYEAITTAVLGPPDGHGRYVQHATTARHKGAKRAWFFRRGAGKTLNALRLIKAAFTFKGGLDYAVWKIERHSGVKITLSDAERRRPLITGARLFFKTVQRGGIR